MTGAAHESGSASPHTHRASAVLYTQSWAYSLMLGMLTLLVPLYLVDALGYSFSSLGIIIGMQGVFQVGLRLFGGVTADRIGERWVILVSFGALLAGALLLATSSALAFLVLAQLLIGGSRAVFWTAAQSYGSRITEGEAGKFLGRFFGYSSVGQMAGAFFGGVVADTIGYIAGFGICAALAGFSMLLTLTMPALPRRVARSLGQILGPVPSVFRSRWTVLPAICAFGTSLSVALFSSLVPAFLKVDVGYSADTIGLLQVVYGIGAVVIGFGFGAVRAHIGQKAFYAGILVGNGAAIVLILLTGDFVWLMGVVMLGMGVAFNAGRVLYAAMTADVTTPEQRGVAMAVVGIYWAAAQLAGPIVFGPLANLLSIVGSLALAGLLIVATGLLTPLLYALFSPKRVGVSPASA